MSTNRLSAILSAEIDSVGKPVVRDPKLAAAVGKTLFDLPGSSDLGVTVLLPNDRLDEAPSQSLVRIVSADDGTLATTSSSLAAGPEGRSRRIR